MLGNWQYMHKLFLHLQLCNVTLSWFPDGISFSSFLCANYHILDCHSSGT